MPRRNLCPNPAAGASATGWFSAYAAPLARVTTSGFTRPQVVRQVGAGTDTDTISPRAAVVPGQTYTGSVDFRLNVDDDAELYLVFFDSSGSLTHYEGPVAVEATAGVVYREGVTGAATGGDDSCAIEVYVPTCPEDCELDVTACLIEPAATIGEYGDGETAGWAWDGTRYTSTSTEVSADPVATTPVDVTVEVLPVTVAAVVATAPVDVVVEPALVGLLHPLPVDVVVDAPPVEAAHVGFVDPVDVVVDVAPVAAGQTAPRPVDVIVEVLPVTIGTTPGTSTEPGQRPQSQVLAVPTTRFLAQSILTGQWLHWDLPLTEPEVTWTLSGPTVITGRFEPEHGDLLDLGLEPWGTWIHVEADGLIRASGILQPASVDGEKLAISAVGPSGYAAKVPYRGVYSAIQVDPADVVRMLWDHIQSQPRGDLGVVVNGSTPVRIGTEKQEVSFETGAGEQVDFTAGPYGLSWWENTLCGREIDQLAQEAPFDYLEQCAWDQNKTAVVHWIDLQHPRIGTRRFGLRFADGGENVLESAPIEEPEGTYASQVYVQGRGEGESSIRGYAGQDMGTRLRLPAVVADKTIGTIERANAVAAEQLAARQAALVECPQIAVDTRHPNAVLGTFGPGDEIALQLADLPWLGEFAAWHRITAITWKVDVDVAVLDLTRQDQFSSR